MVENNTLDDALEILLKEFLKKFEIRVNFSSEGDVICSVVTLPPSPRWLKIIPLKSFRKIT